MAENFRELVEESGQEVLLIVVKKVCTFCYRFLDTHIMKVFMPSVRRDSRFKIVIIDGEHNRLPDEYSFNQFPEIFFVHEEKNSYVPIKWESELNKVTERRKFLREHSCVFYEIDLS